jgi:hypothetical protein
MPISPRRFVGSVRSRNGFPLSKVVGPRNFGARVAFRSVANGQLHPNNREKLPILTRFAGVFKRRLGATDLALQSA